MDKEIMNKLANQSDLYIPTDGITWYSTGEFDSPVASLGVVASLAVSRAHMTQGKQYYKLDEMVIHKASPYWGGQVILKGEVEQLRKYNYSGRDLADTAETVPENVGSAFEMEDSPDSMMVSGESGMVQGGAETVETERPETNAERLKREQMESLKARTDLQKSAQSK